MKTTLVNVLPSSSQSRRQLRNAAAFTLVELLTVIAIIVLLVGMTIGILGFATKKAARSKAEGQMQLLITGLMRYEKDQGEFPEPVDNSGEGSGGAKALYQALTGDGDNHLVVGSSAGGGGSTGKIGTTTDPYVEGIDPKNNKHGLVSADYALVDPFAQYWRYMKYDKLDAQATRNKTFDLWSVAEDRKQENEARWVKNW